MQEELIGILPEIILVVKPVKRSWSASLVWHQDPAHVSPRAGVGIPLEHVAVLIVGCHYVDISGLPSNSKCSPESRDYRRRRSS